MVISTAFLNGKTLLFFEEVLSVFTRISSKTSARHYLVNVERWNEYKNKNDFKYIENQHDMSFLSYGVNRKVLNNLFNKKRTLTAANNCCEVLALYNAFSYLGINEDRRDLPYLLSYFEKEGVILKGYFGTSVLALRRYLKKEGFEYSYFAGKDINESNLTFIQNKYKVFIFLSFNNKKNICDMLHSVCVTKEDGAFVNHNSFDPIVKYDSLYHAVTGYNSYCGFESRPIAIVGFKIKEDE